MHYTQYSHFTHISYNLFTIILALYTKGFHFIPKLALYLKLCQHFFHFTHNTCSLPKILQTLGFILSFFHVTHQILTPYTQSLCLVNIHCTLYTVLLLYLQSPRIYLFALWTRSSRFTQSLSPNFNPQSLHFNHTPHALLIILAPYKEALHFIHNLYALSTICALYPHFLCLIGTRSLRLILNPYALSTFSVSCRYPTPTLNSQFSLCIHNSCALSTFSVSYRYPAPTLNPQYSLFIHNPYALSTISSLYPQSLHFSHIFCVL